MPHIHAHRRREDMHGAHLACIEQIQAEQQAIAAFHYHRNRDLIAAHVRDTSRALGGPNKRCCLWRAWHTIKSLL
jgi:hypothetical protein